MIQNHELKLAYDFVNYTNRNIFLTGKAGTGKTTFLHRLKAESHKRMVVVAPTGVAAINAGGVTIHSFFQMPFGPIIPESYSKNARNNENSLLNKKFNKKKINIIRSMDLLIIDEISMVRADLLDGIDQVLRKYKNRSLPFGGVQLLMIGDLQQLAPVVKHDEWDILKPYYHSMFFFSSLAFKQSQAISIELKHIYRQNDDFFIKILNEVRNDRISQQTLMELNKRHIPSFDPKTEEGYIRLTTHNANANSVNETQINKLQTEEHSFEAEVTGIFPEYAFPTAADLKVKIGAQVMFVKNDSSPDKLYYNGKIGTIADIDDDLIYVQCPDEPNPLAVDQELWNNVKYEINETTKEIEEEIVGSFLQYPLRLAWAITIHKSQGLTFERAIIDAQAAFAHGQTYVALSRCKTLEGLVLSSRISSNAIICDQTVNGFNQQLEENQPNEKDLDLSKKNYQLALLNELFNYRQLYYQLNKCHDILQENATVILGDLPERISEIRKLVDSELIPVSEKFSQQIHYLAIDNMNVETNTPLQDRLQKACEYFLGKTEQLIKQALISASFESDNYAVSKAVNERLKNCNELIGVKIYCLKACKDGFVVKEYLTIRAKALLQKSDFPVKSGTATKEVKTAHPDLYKALQSWRKEVSHEKDISLYQVATQKVLISITNVLPRTSTELSDIRGVGKKTVKNYANELLEIVNGYCREKGIGTPADQSLF
ncbi:MAG: AAA family ATPase [Bacteroidales bacterium]|nr:AAA family ATPase [Bacteroidales bacterium]